MIPMQNKYIFQPPKMFYFVLAIIVFSLFKTEIQTQFSFINEHFIEPFLAACIIIASFSMGRNAQNLGERLFWFNIRLAMILWFLTKLSMYIGYLFKAQHFIYKIGEYGYFGYFMAMVFAVILKNYQTRERRTLAIQQYGAIFFVLGLFGYLVLIPNQYTELALDRFYSSFLFYIILDAYLMLLFLSRAIQSRRADNFRTYLWLSLASSLFFALDIMEVLTFSELFPEWDHKFKHALWYLPYLCFCMAMNPAIEAFAKRGYSPATWMPSSLLMSIIMLPILHSVGHTVGWFYPEVKQNRDWLLTVWVLAFMYLISRYQLHDKRKYLRLRSKFESRPRAKDKPEVKIDSPFPQIILDGKGIILSVNIHATQLLGYQEDEIKNRSFGSLLQNGDAFHKLLKGIESMPSGGNLLSNTQREVMIEKATGEAIPCYMRIILQKEDNLAVGFVDISALKETKKQALSKKDEFITNLTHEFRTPLTIIQGALEEGVDSQVSPRLRNRLKAALRNNYHILNMVEQLLTLSKLTSTPKLNMAAQPISEVLQNTAELFEPLCEQKHMQFSYSIKPNLWAEVHQDALAQILHNLLTNAYKYTPEKGEIDLKIELNGRMATIVVADTGIGINEEEVAHLFDRFQRASHVSESHIFGVGIGLSIVHELVKAHAWKLSVTSKRNEGSRFMIDIPLITEPTEYQNKVTVVDFNLAEEKQRLNNEENPIKGSKNRDKLLIIEDNSDTQQFLAHLAEPNFETELVGTGERGLLRATENLPDIIICDLMLPDISGFDIVEQLKTNELTAHIPILILTAKVDTESKIMGLQKKVDDYLTKPFNYKELLLRLRNLLNSRELIQTRLKAQFLNEKAFGTGLHQGEMSEKVENSAISSFLERLTTVVEKHYQNEAFNMGELAGQLGLSERQLQRKMRGVLSLTPGEYLREYRLKKAKSLLQTGIQVGLVADQVGFSSQAYFTKCFKEWLGETPSSYQKHEHEQGQLQSN